MLRRLYRCAVRLHPSGFRRRFGDELLYIFDQQMGTLAALGVMLDCVFSLLRQWTLRPHVEEEVAAAPLRISANHFPAFESLDPVPPRTSAIIHGALLSLIVFYMTVLAIPYSWIHVLHLRYPFASYPTQLSHQSNVPVIPHEDVIPTDSENSASKATASSSPTTPADSVRPRPVMILLDPFVGNYTSKYPPAKISIQIEGEYPSRHLSLSLPSIGHSSLALSPVSSRKFAIVGAENSYVDFTADLQGRICCLSLVVNGNTLTAQRR